MQKSKDAAFETLSDPKYSGKMKVSALLSVFIYTRMINKMFIKQYEGHQLIRTDAQSFGRDSGLRQMV